MLTWKVGGGGARGVMLAHGLHEMFSGISTTDEDFKTKLCDRHVDLTFPIVNIPFISSNIPASPPYGVYISQLLRYSRACAQ